MPHCAFAVHNEQGLRNRIVAQKVHGWGFSDLVQYSGMRKGTVHRLLACLVRERLVSQRKADRHYLPGPLMFELGLALPNYGEFVTASQLTLKRLTRKTGMVAYLFLRSGAEFVCAGREGTSNLKGLSIEIGTRRPLLSAAGGIAMLIAIRGEDGAAVLESNVQAIKRFGRCRPFLRSSSAGPGSTRLTWTKQGGRWLPALRLDVHPHLSGVPHLPRAVALIETTALTCGGGGHVGEQAATPAVGGTNRALARR